LGILNIGESRRSGRPWPLLSFRSVQKDVT
jgi:hypothetical protein